MRDPSGLDVASLGEGSRVVVERGDQRASGKGYEYAAVGHPSRDYLWILSRNPRLEDEVYQDILERLEEKGYTLEKLQKTLQPTG